MRLHWSPRSPYVRKVVILAHELGLYSRIDRVRSVAVTTQPNPAIMADNPLNKIPTLVLEDGRALFDSRVICEFLVGLSPGSSFLRRDEGYYDTLRWQALGDGMLDLMIAWRGEQLRPEAIRSDAHVAAFAVKLDRALAVLEEEIAALGMARFDLGHIAIGCALAYADFRFGDRQWQAAHPALANWQREFEARPSALAAPIIDD
ncbi:conserved hypothetical protein [Sphingobium sp. SYK-6]|uniref:glutathione S-transferase family protein n=1 Tax=Sphingobium sp. (strain NBRC 103272 / SYK-6) TaxID=627192 RepID=UPI000227753A|nr:glutathione S-transferase [Sphingobium sp. SYK-6]BAK67795.1 conserved hypothetical protein [Sphingobium sp. SYK-6]